MGPWQSIGPDWPGFRPWHHNIFRVLLPRPKKPFLRAERKGGRPRNSDVRNFEAILWIFRTNCPWTALPERFGSQRTVFRRLLCWQRDGNLRRLWECYLSHLGREDFEGWWKVLERNRLSRQPLWKFELDYIYSMRAGRPLAT